MTREHRTPCRGCSTTACDTFDIERLCPRCYVAFYDWLKDGSKNIELFLSTNTTLRIFDFRRPETRIVFDEWLEGRNPDDVLTLP